MTHRLDQLMERLERLWVDPVHAELTQLTALLAERQEVLNEIQNSDTSSLCPESRRELADRIRTVRERDQRLLAALRNRRTEAVRKLDGVMHARTAVRGYRPADTPAPRGPDRIA